MFAHLDVTRLRRWWALEKVAWWLVFRQRERAIEVLRDWERHDADDVEVCSRLGYLLAQQGRIGEALDRLERAARLSPQNPTVHYNLAFVLQQQGAHEAALSAFEAALALRPDHDLALYGKALSLIHLQRQSEAIDPLRRVIALQPMSPFAYYQLAHLYYEQGQAERALRLIAQLRRFEPKVAAQLEQETGLRAPLS